MSIATSMAVAQSAHVHGEGHVNIAIDGNRVSVELESPGADIVGFEHEAHTNDEKAAITEAIAQLGDPMLLMHFEAEADCEVRSANAEIEGKYGEHEDEEHAEHDEHESEESHGAFVAEYEFECADIGALGFIDFTYFSQFGDAHSLDIVLIDENGQRSEEIDRANPVLKLKK